MAKRAKTGLAQRRGSDRRSGLLQAMGAALSKGLHRVVQATVPSDELDALDLLTAQHRAVDGLFRQIQSAKGTTKATRFRELADLLAMHATIEERILDPAFEPTGRKNCWPNRAKSTWP